MIPYTRVVNATIDSSTPKGSSRPGCAFFEFGTISAMASTPAMTNGTFTRNTEPRQKYLSSVPPRNRADRNGHAATRSCDRAGRPAVRR
jgi:hypothetical protein